MTTVPVNGFMSNLLHTATLMVNFIGQQGSCQPSKANPKASTSNAPNTTLSSSSSSSASSTNEFQPQISVEKSPTSPASSVSSSTSAAASTSAASPAASEHPDEFPSDSKGQETEETPRRTHVPYILNGQLYEIQTQEGENVTVKCCHCPSNRVYRGSVRSTGNFHMHIKRRHPELLEKLHEMRVHALLERRDRILRSRRHRQCTNRKRSTVFGSGLVANLQFTRANKALRLKRTLSNISTISRTSLTPNNSPPPRPQTSLMEERALIGENEEGNRQSSQQQQPTEQDEEGEESSPETHKLKIRTVFQRHKMQQLRNHQEALSSSEATIVEQGKPSLVLNSCSPPALLNGGHLANTSTLQMLTTMQTEDGALPASDLCHQSVLDVPLAAACSKHHCTNYQPISYERKDEAMDTSMGYQPAVNLEKLNGEIHLTSFINRLELMDQAIKQASSSTLIKLENNYEVLDLSLRHGHSANILMDQESRRSEGVVGGPTNDDVISVGSVLPVTSTNNNPTSILSNVTINGHTAADTVASEPPSDGNAEFTLNSMHLNKWEELIRNLDVSLRQLQQELSIRNYIERNRVCLDLAKFQFQNPSFQYKW